MIFRIVKNKKNQFQGRIYKSTIFKYNCCQFGWQYYFKF